MWSFPCTRRFRSRGVHFLVTALQSMSFCMSKGWAWMRLGILLFSRSCRYKCSLNWTQQQQLLCYGNFVLALFNCLPFTSANVFLQLCERGKRMWKFVFLNHNSNFSIRDIFLSSCFHSWMKVFSNITRWPVFFSGEKMPKGDSFLKMKYSAISSHFLGKLLPKSDRKLLFSVRCNQSTLVYKSIPVNL